MEPKEFDTMNTYNVLVKNTLDHYATEWFGSLTLVSQENGETFLDISFSDQEILCESLDQSWDPNNAVLSIEITENGNRRKVETLYNTV
jgi:hypothetical protein